MIIEEKKETRSSKFLILSAKASCLRIQPPFYGEAVRSKRAEMQIFLFHLKLFLCELCLKEM